MEELEIQLREQATIVGALEWIYRTDPGIASELESARQKLIEMETDLIHRTYLPDQ